MTPVERGQPNDIKILPTLTRGSAISGTSPGGGSKESPPKDHVTKKGFWKGSKTVLKRVPPNDK